MGALIGLLVGLALAVVLHQFDSRIRRFADVPTTAGLRDLGAVRAGRAGGPAADTALSKSATSTDDIRSLRTGLLTTPDERPARVVGVTTTSDDAERASVAVELARSFAQAGESVVLVDADLRASRLPDLVGLPAAPGLWDVLTAAQPWTECLSEDSAGLTVLPPGSPDRNPADALASGAMSEVLTQLGEHYDRVIIHSTALLGVPDTAEYVRWLDGVVILCRYNRTTREQLSDATALLRRVGGTALGVVITRVPPRYLSGAGQTLTPVNA